ncbi:mitochondrial fission 1 protein A-like isoform X2 [Papaver somniferum]|uniref:mitochondrial fission 1 protein A-like isoform X2 n=1 Tax=Papaver somniferum TaxID=3469 RepID=UPI000E6FF650|nr:mitochondrial fission 1 protein A-like isoform X2 [Papaver somniferum]
MDLEGVVGRFAGMVVASLIREDNFPLYDVMIHDYKEDLKNYPANTQTDVINDCILKLCRALVHSTGKENVKEGIQKLEDGYRGVLGVLSPLQKREMLYLLAVAYYRDGDYSRSLSYLNQCLEVAPHFNQALTLKKKFGSVLWFLIGGPHQYYLDMILDCERDIAEAGDDAPDEVKNENIIKLSWALVHTRQPEDVQRGIALLDASLETGGLRELTRSRPSQLQIRDMLYIRSLGHYINRDFMKSMNDVCQCLDAPGFWQGWYLRRTLLNRTETDGLLGALFFYAASAAVPAIMKARSLRKT